MKTIRTKMTDLLGIRYPIIGAPMFLVSNEDMVVEISEAGGIGTFPALNYRPISNYVKALKEIKSRTKKPVGVNIIVNKSNVRQKEDLHHALDAGVELFITSLGSPREVIREAHKNGAKVFCDVTNLEHALKVQDMGADGVVAVSSGAGGHAGPVTPMVLIPWLKTKVSIPVIAAGGIANGATFASALSLGSDGVHVGTRFIASKECQVQANYKNAIVDSSPEDIVLTTKVSGTPCTVINTPDVQKMGLELPWIIRMLKENPKTKKIVVPLIHALGMNALEKAATKSKWKEVWSAGQSVGLVHEILSCKEIIDSMVGEYETVLEQLPRMTKEEFSQEAALQEEL